MRLGASWRFGLGVLAATASMVQESQFDIAVEVVRVEATVTDNRGAFVSGLSAEDFLVAVSGQLRSVVGIVEVDHAERRPGANGSERSSGGLVVSRPAARSVLATGRSFLIVIDLTHMDPRSLRYARDAGSQFIAGSTLAADRVGVALYSPRRGLTLPVPPTTDHRSGAEWLRALGTERTMGRLEPAGRGIELAALREADWGRESADMVEEVDRLWLEMGAQDLLEALRELANAMAAVPGSKQVVFFSRGLPDQVLANPGFATELTRVVDSARDSGVVIHTFDPGVLPISDVHDLRSMGSRYSTDQRDSSAGAPLLEVAGPSILANRGVLHTLSGETGGTSTFFRHNLEEGLARVEETTRRHYVLAVRTGPQSVPESGDIEIAIDGRPELSVRWWPPRFSAEPVAPPPPEPRQQALRTAAALRFGDDSTEMVAAFLAEPLSIIDGYGRLAIAIEVPVAELDRLGDLARGKRLEFEILGLAVDADRLVEDHFRGHIRLADAKKLREQPFPLRYTNVLVVPPGEYHVKLLVRESNTGLLVSSSVRFGVADTGEDPLRAAMMLAVARDSPVVDGLASGLPEHRVGRPASAGFSFAGGSLAPRIGTAFTGGEPVALFVPIFGVRPHPFTGQPNLNLTLELRDQAGDRTAVTLSRVAAEAGLGPGASKLMIEAVLPDVLPRGRWDLIATITDRVAGTTTVAMLASTTSDVLGGDQDPDA